MIEWKDVVGFEDDYQVSSDGQIRSKDRTRTYIHHRSGKPCTATVQGKVRVQTDSWDGYKEIHLQNSETGKSYYARVHRLVAEAFIPNPENKPHVNHIDGNKKNNCVENLEWCTARENTQHALHVLHGNWMKHNSPTIRIKCLDAGIWFDSMLEAGEWAGGNSSNLILALNHNKPYKGHVFLRESELANLAVSESEYVQSLMSKYKGVGHSFSYKIIGTDGSEYASQTKFSIAHDLDTTQVSLKFKECGQVEVDGIIFKRIKSD